MSYVILFLGRDHISGNGAFDSFYMNPLEEENYRAHGGMGELISVRKGDVIEFRERCLPAQIPIRRLFM